MAKKISLVDSKMEKVIGIVGQASEEITGWAEDAATCMQQINTTIGQINQGIQDETITQEDAVVQLDTEVGKLFRKLRNRIRRMNKNTKALTGLLSAVKAMGEDEDDKK